MHTSNLLLAITPTVPAMAGKNINEVLAENLRRAMGSEGLTQAKLGQMTGMGQTTVGLYLRPHDRKPGKSGKTPSGKLSELEALASALGRPPHELLLQDEAAQAPPPSIYAAVARISAVLASDMPDEIREDAGELLEKLARRKGGSPEQRAQLVALLDSVTPQPLTQAPPIAVDQAVSDLPGDHGPSTSDSGGEPTEGVDEWDTRFRKTTGSLRPKTGGRTAATTSQTKPKAKPGKEKQK